MASTDKRGNKILCSAWMLTYSETWGGGHFAASVKELDFTDCYEQQRVTKTKDLKLQHKC